MARTMTAGAASLGSPAGRIGTGVAALVLLVVAMAARWRTFGNPLVHVDEEFYLLVGGRMLHGVLPFVDIFDRKPIGLFLIYAFAHLLSADGVIPYQLLALLSVTGTATILFAMARRVASDGAALAAAVLYILYLNLAGGEGGQSPVFYNLPVAGGVAILFFARHRPAARAGDLRWPGLGAMLLFGLALQIKYSAVFEGMFVGIMLLALSWRRGRSPGALALDALLWIGAALLPTALAGGVYAALGHLHEWVFANFTSILLRGVETPKMIGGRLKTMGLLLVPLLLAIMMRRWTGARPKDPEACEDLRFLDTWAAVALLGMVLFGTWFDHYALPLFAPLAATAAPLGRSRGGRLYLALLLILAAAIGQKTISSHIKKRGDATVLAEATAATRGYHGCIFVYEALIPLYDSAHSCFPTTRVFPSHLRQITELGATGIDPFAEMRRIMAMRPERVAALDPAAPEGSPISNGIFNDAIRRDYVVLWRHVTGRHRSMVVYGLKPGLAASRRSTRRSGMNQEAAKAA